MKNVIIIFFFLGVQLVESTFIRERNLMPERWVQVTFSTDNIVSKMFVFKVFCRHHIHGHVQQDHYLQ